MVVGWLAVRDLETGPHALYAILFLQCDWMCKPWPPRRTIAAAILNYAGTPAWVVFVGLAARGKLELNTWSAHTCRGFLRYERFRNATKYSRTNPTIGFGVVTVTPSRPLNEVSRGKYQRKERSDRVTRSRRVAPAGRAASSQRENQSRAGHDGERRSPCFTSCRSIRSNWRCRMKNSTAQRR